MSEVLHDGFIYSCVVYIFKGAFINRIISFVFSALKKGDIKRSKNVRDVNAE